MGDPGMDNQKIAEIKLWMMLTSRPDLFNGRQPSDFDQPDNLPDNVKSVINSLSNMIQDENGQPDPNWRANVLVSFKNATNVPGSNPPNAFARVRSQFSTVCLVGWAGAGVGHPTIDEFDISINH